MTDLPARLWAADAALAAVRALPPRGPLAREMRAIRRAEIVGSTQLAGSRLGAAEVEALLDRERAVGDHPFGDYLLVRAYADAADWVAGARVFLPGDRRPLLDVEELRALNARATAHSSLRGGAWRLGNPRSTGGIVAPAAWLVAREVSALLDRFGRGPQAEPTARWLARFLGRFARLVPFEGANGRTGRLAANLMLRRLDAVPLVFERRDRARYPAALAAAESNEPERLATLIAVAIGRVCDRLLAVGTLAAGEARPLRELAGSDYGALAKAAQRGRLRTLVRGGRYYTTPEWVAEYRIKRPSRPAPPSARRLP